MVDMNQTNLENLTALDILQAQAGTEEAQGILHCTRSLNGMALPGLESLSEFLRSNITVCELMYKSLVRQRKSVSDQTRNALLVVAGLVLTATYLATLTPRGGISQGPRNASSSSGGGTSTNSTKKDLLKGLTVDYHLLGKSVMDSIVFLIFYVLNTSTFFLTSVVTMHFLITGPRVVMSLVSSPLAYLFACCVYATLVISPTIGYVIVLGVFAYMTYPTRLWLSQRSRYAKFLVKKYKYKNYQDGDFWSLY
ncbi:hypothetical protein DITRI_Ditri09bG0123700 [Diplodiscus trichospermus]